MVILIVVIWVMLILLSAVQPHQSTYSNFERTRRAELGGSRSEIDTQRHKYYADIVTWMRIKESLLLLLLALLLFVAYDFGLGFAIGILAIFGYRIIARLPITYRYSQKIYDHYELAIIQAVSRLNPITKLIRRPAQHHDTNPASREELAHVIKQSGRLLAQKELELLQNALHFRNLKVIDYMTPRDEVDAVAVDELLGPLVLDDLHKTGHQQFPVIEGDIDHVVGIVDVQNLLAIDNKKSLKVKQAMDRNVYYVRQEQKLEEALAVLIKYNCRLLIVIDETEETVGLLNLDDIMQALFGYSVTTEFQSYDNRRAVASHTAQ